MAPTKPRDAHNAPVRGDDLRGSGPASTHPGSTEDLAGGFRSVQPGHPRDDRDALRVRGTVRPRRLQVREGVRQASDTAQGSHPPYRTVVPSRAPGRNVK